MGGQRHAPAALPPGKIRYPLYRRLGEPQGRSGRVRKISPPPGFDPRPSSPLRVAIPTELSRPLIFGSNAKFRCEHLRGAPTEFKRTKRGTQAHHFDTPPSGLRQIVITDCKTFYLIRQNTIRAMGRWVGRRSLRAARDMEYGSKGSTAEWPPEEISHRAQPTCPSQQPSSHYSSRLYCRWTYLDLLVLLPQTARLFLSG